MHVIEEHMLQWCFEAFMRMASSLLSFQGCVQRILPSWLQSKPPFRLFLNKAASDEIVWHCKHYTGRGVMRF